MFDKETISKKVSNNYPSLRGSFLKYFKNDVITFDDVLEQLTWSVNENELIRGLHRLHCFLNADQYVEAYPQLEILQHLNDEQRQSLLAMILIDSCKRSDKAIREFNKNNSSRDTVAFFYETLSEKPETYPIVTKLTDTAKQYLQENTFYIHQRHLQFGEVPPDSLHEFKKKLESEPQELKKKLSVQNRFWIINLMAFNTKKLPTQSWYEKHGPTADIKEMQQLRSVQQQLEQCIKHESLDPLRNFYRQKLSFQVQNALSEHNIDLDHQVFIGRLAMLLQSKYSQQESNDILQTLVQTQDRREKLINASDQERECYRELELKAVTFLPKVFWKLLEMNKGSKTPEAVLELFVDFQSKLYQKLPNYRHKLAGQTSLPLINIAPDNKEPTFLHEFSQNPEGDFDLNIKVEGFITIQAETKPQLQPQVQHQQQERTAPTLR